MNPRERYYSKTIIEFYMYNLFLLINELYYKDINYYKLLDLDYVNFATNYVTSMKKYINTQTLNENNNHVINNLFGKNFKLKYQFIRLLFNLAGEYITSNKELTNFLKNSFVENLSNKNNDGELFNQLFISMSYYNEKPFKFLKILFPKK